MYNILTVNIHLCLMWSKELFLCFMLPSPYLHIHSESGFANVLIVSSNEAAFYGNESCTSGKLLKRSRLWGTVL